MFFLQIFSNNYELNRKKSGKTEKKNIEQEAIVSFNAYNRSEFNESNNNKITLNVIKLF